MKKASSIPVPLLAFTLIFLHSGIGAEPEPQDRFEIVVYGGTSAGVAAAVQANRMGKSVVIVCPDKHLGGLSAGGLGFTDTGNKAVIGGLAREFYHRVWRHYDSEEAWTWQTRDSYGNKGQGTPAIDGDQRTMWIFEPHVAEQVFEELIREEGIPVFRNEWLNREPGQGVQKSGGVIQSISMLSGKTFGGQVFIDATYEGDLIAATGIDYHVGRESHDTYNEAWNGNQIGVLHHGHHFQADVDPYVVPGDPASGLLPRISPDPPGVKGAGDHRVQAYCFRMCLSNHPENRVPFAKPEDYDAGQYELLARVFASGWREVFHKFDPIPNRKTDTNNHGPFSTDNIGMNYDYPEASYERRRKIIAEHETYQKGLMFFLTNDSRVPEEIREQMSQWGLAKDEFSDNGHWPHQIYVREARRMIGPYVMTEHDCLSTVDTPKSVGMGSYTIDSHNVRRYVKADGFVQNEGDIGVGTGGPYRISYDSLTPKQEQCKNLLVPVCVSSSHIAFGSIRMEPVFMILGQSSATAASIAIDQKIPVQQVPYDQLQERLLADGQVLSYDGPRRASKGIPPQKFEGIVVDDSDAENTDGWKASSSIGPFVGQHYLHDNNEKKGELLVRFHPDLPSAGRYEVRLSYSASENRATNVPVFVFHREGRTVIKVNQRQAPADGPFFSLGTFEFRKGQNRVEIANIATDGHVIVDAVQLLPVTSD
ncbi:MAG: FAD-dependent oxidoreductase [Planctomycetaceae bacterium]|nr:FAD-dependent oxidoreductase [Planctomycetaceae bacterium]